MLLQTNSYIVPKDKRAQHARLVMRFRQTLTRLGCDHFEAYEQVGANWSPADTSGRFVQLMRFRDRKQQLAVQAAERNDATAQALIKEFCELINFPYQQQQGLFAVGFYHSLLPTVSSARSASPADEADAVDEIEEESETDSTIESSPEPGEPALGQPVPPRTLKLTPQTDPNLVATNELLGESEPAEMDIDDLLADDDIAVENGTPHRPDADDFLDTESGTHDEIEMKEEK